MRARYLIAADGASSRMRQALGIEMIGPAAAVSAALRVPLDAYLLGPDGNLDGVEGDFLYAYGLASDRAVLVRPAGHVAGHQHAAPRDPQGALAAALATVTGRRDDTAPSS